MKNPVVTSTQQPSTCGSVAAASPLSREDAEALARTLKTVADPTRLQLLSLIDTAPGGEACVCDLAEALGFTQPTVSHHLKILVDAGLLTREKRGTWAWYTVVRERIDIVGRVLGTVVS